ncbi:MAG TPA: hypothetical protein VI894_00315 [Candidatus Nanoarchaeia archaeon]|nr:hypothetical protein [Candidatus Nanoarchaeia archaeon]
MKIGAEKTGFAEQEYDLYTKRGVIDCAENDQISSEEEGFMLGYLSCYD